METGFLEVAAAKDRAKQERRANLEEEKAREKEEQCEQEKCDADRATEAEPTNAAGWHRRAELYRARGLLLDAMSFYRNAVELDPEQNEWMVAMWDLEKQLMDTKKEKLAAMTLGRKEAAEQAADQDAKAQKVAGEAAAVEAKREENEQYSLLNSQHVAGILGGGGAAIIPRHPHCRRRSHTQTYLRSPPHLNRTAIG